MCEYCRETIALLYSELNELSVKSRQCVVRIFILFVIQSSIHNVSGEIETVNITRCVNVRCHNFNLSHEKVRPQNAVK